MSIGARLAHESAVAHVTGRAHYVDDLPTPAATLHGLTLTSPHARARIVSLDVGPARTLPGVRDVLVAADIPGANNVGPVFHDEPLLAAGEVHCVGQSVALVLADSREAARRALDAILVEYEPLEPVLTLAEGIERGDFIGDTHRMRRGDAAAALASAPRRLSGTVDSGGQEHFYLETHASLALPGDDGRSVELQSSTQHPSEVQTLVAEVLGWARARVTVVSPRMGGAFGGKETQAAPWAALAALGAVRTGRPVKLWLDRDRDMTTTGRRHPFHTRYQVGFDDEGRLLALDAQLYADAGWAADLSLAILDRALYHTDNAYFLPNVALDGYVVRTNKTSNTAFRGFGGPQGIAVIETVLDRIAWELGLDPVEVRRRNLYGEAPRNLTPYHQEITAPRTERLLDELLATSDYAARRQQVVEFNAGSPWVKRGLALTPLKFGISFTITLLNQAGAYVVLYADGSAQLNHGGTEMGQGLYTKMLQVCATGLGVDPDRIRPMATRTDKVPNTSATAASSGSDLNGAAVADACRTLVERLRPVAGELLGHPSHVVQTAADPHADMRPLTADGEPAWAWVAADRGVSFAEVVAAAYVGRVPLAATGFYRTPGIWYDRAAGRGKPFYYYVYGAAVSEVEVSLLTGQWRMLRVDILHDVGDSLSPDIDRGQIEGGFLQGVGWVTTEELVFGDRGELLTHAPSTYKIPAVGDVPEVWHVDFLRDAHQPGVVGGSKAVGEPPFMLALSVHRALADAVRAAGPGEAQLALPATNEAILAAVEAARG